MSSSLFESLDELTPHFTSADARELAERFYIRDRNRAAGTQDNWPEDARREEICHQLEAAIAFEHLAGAYLRRLQELMGRNLPAYKLIEDNELEQVLQKGLQVLGWERVAQLAVDPVALLGLRDEIFSATNRLPDYWWKQVIQAGARPALQERLARSAEAAPEPSGDPAYEEYESGLALVPLGGGPATSAGEPSASDVPPPAPAADAVPTWESLVQLGASDRAAIQERAGADVPIAGEFKAFFALRTAIWPFLHLTWDHPWLVLGHPDSRLADVRLTSAAGQVGAPGLLASEHERTSLRFRLDRGTTAAQLAGWVIEITYTRSDLSVSFAIPVGRAG